jgi:hypothetical protein
MIAAQYERIDASTRFDGAIRDSHEMRYRLAAGFVEPGDTVLDACCGTGYGRPILAPEGSGVDYFGIDRDPPEGSGFMCADFDTGEGMADFVPDVFVGLEAIEHLTDAGVQRFVDLACDSRRAIVVSTPLVRRKRNPFHKQFFNESDMVRLFDRGPWRHFGTLTQSGGLYGLYVFLR